MDRRTACAALAAMTGAVPSLARSQPSRLRQIAWVAGGRPTPDSPSIQNFRRGLRELGRVEGRDIALAFHWGEGSPERLNRLVPIVVASQPEVIVIAGGPVLQPFIDANVTLPIVFTISSDPVAGKVVASYARPVANRTGISFFGTELIPKRLSVLQELKPTVKRLGIVGWSKHAGEAQEVAAATAEATRLGWASQYHPVDTTADLEAAFGDLARWRPDAVLAFADSVSLVNAPRFAAFGERQRIPCVSAWAIFAEGGNVMTYGPNLEESYARLATHVDRILKGARASELPVERPRTIELVINRRAAKDLGLALTPALLARANQIID